MAVRYWMLLNVDRCESVTDLIEKATNRFNYKDTPRWMWNDAQYLWDLHEEERLRKKYAK